jgi:hypothetical protein
MIANVIAMVLVVATHYNTLERIAVLSGYDLNYTIQEALANGFARSAVPIFALLSGYFLSKKVANFHDYRLTMTRKIHTLLIPYLLASALIYASTVFLQALFHQEQNQHFDLYSIAYNVIAHPVTVQFWYLRDLIILTVASPILFNLNRYALYGIGGLLFVLWSLNIQPFPIVAGWYFLNIETLFFFWLGGVFFQKYILAINAIIFCNTKAKVTLFALWAGIVASRVYIDPDLDVWYVRNYTLESILLYKLAIIIGVVSILQASTILRNSRFLIYMSGLTFFVFLFHLTPLSHFKILTRQIVAEPYLFYVNFPIALFLTFLLAHITSKYFGGLYEFTCGGRNPQKTLQRMRSGPEVNPRKY